ncbi:hypothetical protein WUBG_18851 [Wuchereria bancrofti]|nr:hypothetical protein WUBG_18851 [Wuchereria bancrofti]
MECILKTKIQIYKQTQEDKKRIVAKLELLGCVDSLPCKEDVSAVQIHNDTSTPFSHQSLEI